MENDLIRESLQEIKNDVKQVGKDVADIKTDVAVLKENLRSARDGMDDEIAERKALASRVSDLERFKWKLLGGASIGSASISLVISLLLKILGI